MRMKNFFKKSQRGLLLKTVGISLCLLFTLVINVWAFKRFPDSEYGVPTAKNSGAKTADTAILATAGIFYGIMVVTDGSNACTVSIYDNASAASGTKYFPTVIVPATASSGQAISMGYGILAANGIYVDITTAGTCTFNAYYDY